MKTEEMIKVMQHFENGGEVECQSKDFVSKKWHSVKEPSWNWGEYNYRVKEQKQKVTIEKWLCKNKQNDFIIIETSDIEVYMTHYDKIKLLETYEVEL